MFILVPENLTLHATDEEIYSLLFQLHDFDTCIAKNEEALHIDPHFAECYGNMANAWKVF